MSLSYFSTTGKVRKKNQDFGQYFVKSQDEFIAIICDGMGGSLGGEIASSTTIEFFIEEYKLAPSFVGWDITMIKKWFKSVIDKILQNWKITVQENNVYENMGTTVVCAIKIQNVVYVANIGDSRAYLFTNNHLKQITKDHSLPQLLFNKGIINQEELSIHPQKNILYNVLTFNREYQIDWFKIKDASGLIILMSDGIYNMVSKEKMWSILQANTPLDSKVVEFCNEANDLGGLDNNAILIGEINESN